MMFWMINRKTFALTKIIKIKAGKAEKSITITQFTLEQSIIVGLHVKPMFMKISPLK